MCNLTLIFPASSHYRSKVRGQRSAWLCRTVTILLFNQEKDKNLLHDELHDDTLKKGVRM